MSKLTRTLLAGGMLALVTPAYAGRGGGENLGNIAVSDAGQGTVKLGSCRRQQCGNGMTCARRKPCKTRKGWFTEGLDPLIR